MQERLTTQIADALERVLEPRGVIVVIEAEHLCMTMRGRAQAGREDGHVGRARRLPTSDRDPGRGHGLILGLA